MLKFVSKQHKLIFAAGAATGFAVLGFLKTKKARELAVKGVAGGIMLKEKVLETAANIKEEADDICAEAKATARKACSCSDGCDCGDNCNCDDECNCGENCDCK